MRVGTDEPSSWDQDISGQNRDGNYLYNFSLLIYYRISQDWPPYPVNTQFVKAITTSLIEKFILHRGVHTDSIQTILRPGQFMRHLRGTAPICLLQLHDKTITNVNENLQSIYRSFVCSYLMYWGDYKPTWCIGVTINHGEQAARAQSSPPWYRWCLVQCTMAGETFESYSTCIGLKFSRHEKIGYYYACIYSFVAFPSQYFLVMRKNRGSTVLKMHYFSEDLVHVHLSKKTRALGGYCGQISSSAPYDPSKDVVTP